MDENCGCENKEYIYICDDEKCIPVTEEPKCFTQKSTFYRLD